MYEIRKRKIAFFAAVLCRSRVLRFHNRFAIFFFLNGAFYGVMPYYFIFAVVFTVFMVDGIKAVLIAALELVIYIGLCLYTYWGFDLNDYAADRGLMLIDSILGFVTVSVTLGLTMFLLFRLYNTQQRELESARARLAEENALLDKINKLKTEFLSNVAHELKTPLTVMSGYAQMAGTSLNGAAEAAGLPDQLRLITSEADRLALMVSQLLDVSRIWGSDDTTAPDAPFTDLRPGQWYSKALN